MNITFEMTPVDAKNLTCLLKHEYEMLIYSSEEKEFFKYLISTCQAQILQGKSKMNENEKTCCVKRKMDNVFVENTCKLLKEEQGYYIVQGKCGTRYYNAAHYEILSTPYNLGDVITVVAKKEKLGASKYDGLLLEIYSISHQDQHLELTCIFYNAGQKNQYNTIKTDSYDINIVPKELLPNMDPQNEK